MSKEAVKSISLTEAHGLVQKDARTAMINVCSNMEFLFIGHPLGRWAGLEDQRALCNGCRDHGSIVGDQ